MAQDDSEKKGRYSVKKAMFGTYILTEDILENELPKITEILPLVAEAKLGNKAKRVLALKLIPGSAFLSIKTKCEILGINPRYWHYLHGQQKFRDVCEHYAKKVAPSVYMNEIIGTHIVKAKLGDVKSAAFVAQYAEQLKTGSEPTVNFNITIEQMEKQREEKRRNALEKYGLVRVVSPN